MVQELLGHSSVQLTLDTHSHLSPIFRSRKRAAARLDAVLGGTASAQTNWGQIEAKEEENLVTRIFTSWNQMSSWLRELQGLQRAA